MEYFQNVLCPGGPPDNPALRPNHFEGRLLEGGEVAFRGVFDQKTLKTAVIRFAHGCLDANFGGDSRDEQVGDLSLA